MIKYDRLWETLKVKKISQSELTKKYGVSTGQMDRLRKNGVVYTSTIDNLCTILSCDITDIMEFHKENKQ